MRTSVEYDPEATSLLWEKTLAAVFPDATERTYLQTALGYSTTGEMNLDKWFLPNGPTGRNGKGTILGAVAAALAEYAIELDAATFDRRKERPPYNLAKLPGKRFAHCAEAGDSTTLHHDRIKQVSGGDKVRAGDKFQRDFEFHPVSKLWFTCNTRPKVYDETAAFWARVVVLPFAQSFAGREDPSIRDDLRQKPEHQRAILCWLVEGARRYYSQNGLGTMPPAFTKATAEFQLENKTLAEFYEECCDISTDVEEKAGVLWKAYKWWSEQALMKHPLGSKTFYHKVASQFEKVSRNDGVWYQGLALKPDVVSEMTKPPSPDQTISSAESGPKVEPKGDDLPF
jgi:putative DNA primase/helicase